MSQQPQCVQCGGTEYILESGYYFCAECHVQSQDIQERVFEDDYAGPKGTRHSLVAPRVEDSIILDSAEKLTSWEILNYMLKGLVDELVLLGASKDLKLIVLQLWVTYLNKIEAAFLSVNHDVKPRLGFAFKISDAEKLYGVGKAVASIYKEPVYRRKRKEKSSKTSTDTSGISSRSIKIRLALKRKALAKAEYQSMSEVSHSSPPSSLISVTRTVSGSQKSFKLKHSKRAKTTLNELLECAGKTKVDEERKNLQRKLYMRERTSLYHPHLTELLTIIRLGLIITNSQIQLSDIFRWSQEGYLSLRQTEKLLPKGIKISKDLRSFFSKNISSWDKVQRSSWHIANLLGCTYARINVLDLCKRYVEELSLPNDVITIIKKMMVIKPPNSKLNTGTNFEGSAMAYIIVVIKLLFSLNDFTEYKLSHIADKINNESSSEERKIFSWESWQGWTEQRLAVMAAQSHNIRQRFYPDSRVGGAEPFISQWDHSPPSQHIPRRHFIDRRLADTLKGIIGPFCRDAPEPFPPSLTPLTDITKTLQERGYLPRSISFAEMSLDPFVSVERFEKALQEISFNYIFIPGMGIDPVCVKKKIGWRTIRYSEKVKYLTEAFVKVRVIRNKEKNSENEFPDLTEPNKKRQLGKRSSSNGDGGTPESFKSKSDTDIDDIDNSKRESIYIPYAEYWIYEGSFGSLSLYEFDEIKRNIFSTSFSWFLDLCAKLIHQTPKELYVKVRDLEVKYFSVEKFCKRRRTRRRQSNDKNKTRKKRTHRKKHLEETCNTQDSDDSD